MDVVSKERWGLCQEEKVDDGAWTTCLCQLKEISPMIEKEAVSSQQALFKKIKKANSNVQNNPPG